MLFSPVWCEWIIAETWRVLTVQQLRRLPSLTAADERRLSASANSMLTTLLQVMTFVSVVPPFDPAWIGIGDMNDLPIWSAALRTGARFIVSHNVRDFPPRNADGLCAYAGIEFVTTESFVCDVLGLDAAEVAPVGIPPSGHIAHQRRI